MKKNNSFLFIIALLYIPAIMQGLTFHITLPNKGTNTPTKFNFQTNLEAGARFEGMASTYVGAKDFATLFLKPSFFINDFGIGFSFRFRFRNTPEMLQFNTADYSFTEDSYLTFCRILDMIDFISYGNPESPLYLKTGKLPYISVGNGLVFSQFHNRFFEPCDRENGFYFHLNLKDFFQSSAAGRIPPLSFTTYVPDIADPDQFIFGTDLSITPYIPLENLQLDTALYFGFDFDAGENNLLNCKNITNVISYRAPEWTEKTVRTITAPATLCYTLSRYAKMTFSQETAFLWRQENFDFAASFFTKGEFIYLENSGFLLGIPFGIICKTDGFYPGYFGLNYENVRSSQYFLENSVKNILFRYGISLSAFNQMLEFGLLLTSPFEMGYFTASYEGYLTIHKKAGKDSPISVDSSVRYRTAMSQMDITGSGGNFLESITRKFRFSAELNMRIYCSRLVICAGVEAPNWMEYLPEVENAGPAGYAEMTSNTRVVNLETYGNFLIKFMQLEVAIAF